MPYIKIHWKGYPQHRLPKIQVASTPSVSVRNRSTAAAQQVTKLSLGPGLEQERKKNRFNFRVRRRRGRSSRTSEVAQAKRRASQRARQNIQVVGCDTPNAELASKATTELRLGSRQFTPRSPRVSPPTAHLQNETESVTLSTDGAASSIVRRAIKPKESESRYSLMHIAELPTKPQSRKKFSFESDQLSVGSTRRAGGEYAHTISRDRAYDTRIDPKTRAGIRRRTIIPPNRPFLREASSVKTLTKKKKPQSLTSPEFWEVVNSIASQSKKEGSDSSIRSIVLSVFSEISCTRSKRKALRRFTKEIELYLQAARTLPKQSLVPSITATSISANTILELKPYQSQFQSAGLAVTSKEQRGETPLREVPNPPPTPPKDEKWENMAILSRKSKKDLKSGKKEEKGKATERGPLSFASGSTGTTVLGFTPPHEKSYPRPRMEREQSSIETDHTILGFTPPHEKMNTPLPPLPTFQEFRPTTKRSLPWLRRASQSPEVSPTTKMSAVPVEREQQPRLSTPLQGWVSTFETIDKATPVENENQVEFPENRPVATSRHSSATKWRDSRVGICRITPTSTEEETKVPARISFTAVKYTGGDSKPCRHVNNNVDTAVQPDALDDDELESGLLTAPAKPPLVSRASIPTSRNKTLPMPPNKCKGDCKHAAGGSIIEHPRKKSELLSRVTWPGAESSTQTGVTIATANTKPQQATDAARKKLSLPSSVQAAERSDTFPLTSWNTRSSKIVQQAPRLKSPRKSLDESKAQPTSHGEALDPSTPPSRRPPSPPPLCSHCAQPINPVSENPSPESTYEFDHDAEVTPKPGPSHACTSRSMPCQQCFPSRQVSLEMSPLRASSPVEVSYHSSSRRSTRPIIPTEPVTYPEEVSVSPEQQSTQVIQCLNLAEGQEMHQNIVKEAIQEFSNQIPVADPVKRPSVTAPKVQPTPRPQPSSRRIQPSSSASRVKVLPPVAQRPLVITTACSLDHVASSSTSLDNVLPKFNEITDKQIFRGLHVATAAVCDEDVDKWIEEITGTGVRRFLADLSAFESLGVNTLANVAKRAARQRREQLKAWEEVRERKPATQSREVQLDPSQYQGQEQEEEGLTAGGFSIGDQGVEWKGEEESEDNQGDDLMMGDQGVEMRQTRDGLVGSMLHRRESKASEGARERAVIMGWRERIVSG